MPGPEPGSGEVTSILRDRLTSALDLTEDLATSLDADAFAQSLQEPSNTIWDQLWCVVGARESYARAMEAGAWAGFSCSLSGDDRGSKAKLIEALGSSHRAVVAAIDGSDEDRAPLVLDLLLHETQHQGQLIRYVYGLGLKFPTSWKKRWNL